MSTTPECQGDQANHSFDLAIKNWHAAEAELKRMRDALTQILRLQTGVSAQAKAIARSALTNSQ
jgi:hypothetical protein